MPITIHSDEINIICDTSNCGQVRNRGKLIATEAENGTFSLSIHFNKVKYTSPYTKGTYETKNTDIPVKEILNIFRKVNEAQEAVLHTVNNGNPSVHLIKK